MIFTLLCHMILLDSWTSGQPQGLAPTFISSQSSSSGGLSNSEPPNHSRYSRVQRQATRRDWLYPPTFSPFFAPRSSATGLAYRSIFPSRDDYTKIYRNGNLWSDSSDGGGIFGEKKSSPSSSKSENTIPSSVKGISKNDLKTVDGQGQRSGVTTEEPRSAPATDAFSSGRASSTVEMHSERDEYVDDVEGAIEDRREMPGPDGTKVVIHRRKSKVRQEESMIVFPSDNQGRNRTESRKRDDAVSSYVPPSLKLSKATLESLRKLIDARKHAESVVNNTAAGSRQGQRGMGRNHSPSNVKGVSNFLAIDRTPNCNTIGQEYCEDIDDYPKEYIGEQLRSLFTPAEFNEAFGTLEEVAPSPSSIISRDDIPGSDETTLCNSVEHVIHPKAARNKEGKYLYIVNHEEYVQGLRIEKCLSENSECSQLGNGAMPGYTSACRQKYIYKKMLAYSPDGKPIHDTFKFPSCCVCYIRSSLGIVDRREPTSPKKPFSDPIALKKEAEDAEEVTESYLSDSVAETTVHDTLTFVDYPVNVSSSSADDKNNSHSSIPIPKVEDPSSRYFLRNFYK